MRIFFAALKHMYFMKSIAINSRINDELSYSY